MCMSFITSRHNHTFSGMVDNFGDPVLDVRCSAGFVPYIDEFAVLDGDCLGDWDIFISSVNSTEDDGICGFVVASYCQKCGKS